MTLNIMSFDITAFRIVIISQMTRHYDTQQNNKPNNDTQTKQHLKMTQQNDNRQMSFDIMTLRAMKLSPMSLLNIT